MTFSLIHQHVLSESFDIKFRFKPSVISLFSVLKPFDLSIRLALVQDLSSSLNLICRTWLSLNRYRHVHLKVEIKLFQVCLLLHMLIPSWTGLFLSGIKTCYLNPDSRICHAQRSASGLQLDLMRLSFNQV